MSAEWQPATERERALAAAARAGDQDSYVPLLRDQALLVPVRHEVLDHHSAGASLYCYTSPRSLATLASGQPVECVTATLEELVRRWPGGSGWLVIDSGTPLEMSVELTWLAGALGVASPPAGASGPEPAPPLSVPRQQVWHPANAVEETLLDGRLDPGEALKVVLLAELVVPIPDGASPRSRPGEPEFVWRVYRSERGLCVPLFTSLALCARQLGPVPAVSIPTVDVLAAWPDARYAMAVNPGSPMALLLPGPRVTTLGLWLDRVGLSETL